MKSLPLLALVGILTALIPAIAATPAQAGQLRLVGHSSRFNPQPVLLAVGNTPASTEGQKGVFSTPKAPDSSIQPVNPANSKTPAAPDTTGCTPSGEPGTPSPDGWSYLCVGTSGARFGFPATPETVGSDDYLWVGSLDSVRVGYRVTGKVLARPVENTAKNRKELIKLFVADASPRQVGSYKEITVAQRPVGSIQGIYQSEDRPSANVTLLGIIDGDQVYLVEIVTVKSSLTQHQATVQKLLAKITFAPQAQ